MLEISSRNGSRNDPLIGPRVISRSCQTEYLVQGLGAPPNSIPNDESSNASNGGLSKTLNDSNPNGLSYTKDASSKAGDTLDERQVQCLSTTKDISIGNSRATTSSPGMINFTDTSTTAKRRNPKKFISLFSLQCQKNYILIHFSCLLCTVIHSSRSSYHFTFCNKSQFINYRIFTLCNNWHKYRRM